MRRLRVAVVAVMVGVTSALFAADRQRETISLDQVMTKTDQIRTGVRKLSRPEKAALEEWLTAFTAAVAREAIRVSNEGRKSPSEPRAAKAYAGVGGKHWVQRKIDSGAFIELEDGSLWEISPLDKINTMLWLPVDDIVVMESDNPSYPYKLVGKRDSAEARPAGK